MGTINQVNQHLLDFIRKSEKKPLRTGKGSVIYTRVSSKEQAEQNTSLDTQKKSCEDYCLKNGYTVKKYFGGTFESAKSDERKEFENLIEYVHKERTVEAIIVYTYDRFSRSGANAAYLTEELSKVGVRLIAASQHVDTSTASGKFHRNMLLMFSQFDNEQRRDKCIAGMVENLRQGYWVSAAPFGYTNLHKKEKARNHKYVINQVGEILKKGFELKAQGILTNKEIVEHLNSLGCKIHYKSFVSVISNPFYCGYITNSIIPNEIYKGHHTPLVSEELFFKANSIVTQSPLKGIAKKFKIEELPLKSFAKDEISNSPFTGYRQKGIYYYKTRDVGSCVNVRAAHLNGLFSRELKKFEFDKIHHSELKDSISTLLLKRLESRLQDQSLIEQQIRELKKKNEALEVRFIEAEISKELFDKYSLIYNNQLGELEAKLKRVNVNSSNLEEVVDRGLEIAENISDFWVSTSFDKKKELQNIVFPEGILYNKKIDAVRTPKINSFLAAIPLLTGGSREKINARSVLSGHNSSQVAPTGIEPVSKV
jgi:site-specific DNA recombinase